MTQTVDTLVSWAMIVSLRLPPRGSLPRRRSPRCGPRVRRAGTPYGLPQPRRVAAFGRLVSERVENGCPNGRPDSPGTYSENVCFGGAERSRPTGRGEDHEHAAALGLSRPVLAAMHPAHSLYRDAQAAAAS